MVKLLIGFRKDSFCHCSQCKKGCSWWDRWISKALGWIWKVLTAVYVIFINMQKCCLCTNIIKELVKYEDILKFKFYIQNTFYYFIPASFQIWVGPFILELRGNPWFLNIMLRCCHCSVRIGRCFHLDVFACVCVIDIL